MAYNNGPRLIELADKSWGEMTPYEQGEYTRWLEDNPQGHNLYILLRHAKRHRRQSSSENIRAVRGSDPPEEPEEP